MTPTIKDQILKLKQETDTCILAHSYMLPDVCEIADFTGDSYALSVKAKTAPQKNIIMCGVRFMAETVKMLSPQKRVMLANPAAGCPMAEQFTKEDMLALKRAHPGYALVAYVNTTAELKTIADVCVTSSSAVKICQALPNKNIIFMPDKNLGEYVKSKIPEKNFILVDGGCPIHAAVREEDVIKAKAAHPKAEVLAHPECAPSVLAHADYIGSTAGIMDYAAKSDKTEFIIGTDNAIAMHLERRFPGKKFYFLSPKLECGNMRKTTLNDVLGCLQGTAGEEIILSEETLTQAVNCINKMIEYGG